MTEEEFSQHLNGVSVAICGVFMVWAIVFLWRETRRRKLTPIDLVIRMPPPMCFTFAVLVFDSGVWLRAMVIWVWRRFYDSGPFGPYQLAGLTAGAFLIAVGGLMKVRAVTKPDWGDLPWMCCFGLACFLFFLL